MFAGEIETPTPRPQPVEWTWNRVCTCSYLVSPWLSWTTKTKTTTTAVKILMMMMGNEYTTSPVLMKGFMEVRFKRFRNPPRCNQQPLQSKSLAGTGDCNAVVGTPRRRVIQSKINPRRIKAIIIGCQITGNRFDTGIVDVVGRLGKVIRSSHSYSIAVEWSALA